MNDEEHEGLDRQDVKWAVKEAVEIFFKTPQFSQFNMASDGSHISMISHRENQNLLVTFDPK